MAVPISSMFHWLPLGTRGPQGRAKKLDLDATARVSIRVSARHEKIRGLGSLLSHLAVRRPHRRRHLTPEEWRQEFGADAQDLDRVADFARQQRLKVTEVDAGLRSVIVEAPLHRLEEAFRVRLRAIEYAGATFRTHLGPLLVPEALESKIAAVEGLDSTPVPHPAPPCGERTEHHVEVRRVGELYGFPMSRTGKGQTVVIVLLGGGFHRQDLDRYFAGLGLAVPRIEVMEIGGAKNRPASSAAVQQLLKAQGLEPKPLGGEEDPGTGQDSASGVAWTIEATTDLQILGAMVPEARIVAVFAANTQDQQVAAIETALGADFKEEYGLPTVISCSWGEYEHKFRDDRRRTMEDALAKAATLGVTVCFSSGDFGGGPVYYPASSAYALACGGTSIVTSPAEAALEEAVWREEGPQIYFASGGGVSEVFAAPEWQKAAVAKWGGARRGVPDLAALASRRRGYALIIGDAEVGMGGTSSAAPLLAGLVVQVTEANQDLKSGYRVGWLTPLLYGERFHGAFVDVTRGDNGLFRAAEGWDPCTGLGRPIGNRILAALREGS